MTGVLDRSMDAVVACAEVVGRAGATEFEVGWRYDDDDPPLGWPTGVPVPPERQGWYANARWSGALLAGDGRDPAAACEELASKILHGGSCIRCGRTINLTPDRGQWAEGNCCWHREGRHWLRGCDGGHS